MSQALLSQPIDQIATPGVDWWGLTPLLLLAAPAMVLLHVSSLLSRVFRGFYALATVIIAGAAGGVAIYLWNRLDDEGASSTLGGAYGVDGFSIFLTVVMCASVILAALVADDYLRREEMDGAELYALMLLSAAGGVIMASANDLIVTFLGLEVLSIAVYILAAMHLRRSTSQEAGMKYFVLGAFSSAFFLYGIALIYGATGSTSLLDIRDFFARYALTDNGLFLAGLAFLLVGLGFKVAAVPFHVWTPDVYQGAPSPVVAYMASGVKAAGFAGLLRVFVVAFDTQRLDWQPIVYGLAVLTLLGGSIFAVVQTDVKRMMAYSSISHAGFILVGVQAASRSGTAASLFYLGVYTFMVAGSFAVITLVGGKGDDRHALEDYRGLSSTKPVLAFGFAILLLAQAGVPLTSGFFAKFYIIGAAIEARSFWLAIVAMGSAVIGAFIYLRIIVAMFMSGEPEPATIDLTEGDEVSDAARDAVPVPGPRIPIGTTITLGLAFAFTVIVGFFPGLIVDLANDAVPALVAAG